MNEPATGDIPADPMRFGHGAYAHDRYHNQYALLMAMAHHRGTARGDARAADLRAVPGGFRRHPALRGQLDGRQHGPLGPPVAQHRDGRRLRASPDRRSSARTSAASRADTNPELFLRWMQYGVLTPFCRNHSEIDNVDQYAWAFGEVIEAHRPRRDQAALPADALPVRVLPRRVRDRRAGPAADGLRPPVRRHRPRSR